VLTNYREDLVEEMEAVNNPEDISCGTRKVPFSRVLYIEQQDFMENPPKNFYRLAPGREVRLRYGYFIKCNNVVKDPNSGKVVELHCTYDPQTRGGNAPDGRRAKVTLHWVSAAHAVQAEVRLYDVLFLKENPEDVPDGADFTVNLNPKSLEVLNRCCLEPSLKGAKPGERFQFERMGYFCVDLADSSQQALVFNRIVTLKDEWERIQKAQGLK
jgi:glutaminyl-tRNA synthetase